MENLWQRVKMEISRIAERAHQFSYTDLEY